MPVVHIVYGFTEGYWHGNRLRKALQKHDYAVSDDISAADYVIAHSGGCFSVPPLEDHQVLVLVNPTYWPGRPLNERANNMTKQIFKAIRPGNQFLFHLNKLLHNIWYFGYHLRTNLFMIKSAETFNLEQEITHQRTILVRNDGDPWLTPELGDLKQLNAHLHIERLPGEHDDLWMHPQPYIEILERYR